MLNRAHIESKKKEKSLLEKEKNACSLNKEKHLLLMKEKKASWIIFRNPHNLAFIIPQYHLQVNALEYYDYDK